MGLIVALAIGGILGWIAALLNRSDARGGTPRSVIVGILGALLGAFILGPLFGGGNLLESQLDTMTIVISFVGAAVLLALLTFLRRRRAG